MGLRPALSEGARAALQYGKNRVMWLWASPTMFPRDGDPVRISFGPIGPALQPNLELVGCPAEPLEKALPTSMIRENQNAICHKASRFLF